MERLAINPMVDSMAGVGTPSTDDGPNGQTHPASGNRTDSHGGTGDSAMNTIPPLVIATLPEISC
jgi:hypothetical protein